MIVADAAKNGIKLDYSVESLKSVDIILGSLHKEYEALGSKKSPEMKSGYQGYAQMLGCYMLAVVDKNKVPGKLTIVNDEYGTGVGFTFASGVFSDFVSWCQKAIVNGSDDAVLPKFQHFSRSAKV
ncbi:MAG TPA: hypothetical protein VLF69_04540 [Candidatus Saccharimonadales bacterium]|nr:hypothetical protein [Candidatus Saccharimonadales bacterium]